MVTTAPLLTVISQVRSPPSEPNTSLCSSMVERPVDNRLTKVRFLTEGPTIRLEQVWSLRGAENAQNQVRFLEAGPITNHVHKYPLSGYNVQMETINTYINRPLKQRREHLRLNQKCSEIGGNSSAEFKALLAYYVGTTIPFGGEGYRVHLCHACGNEKCSNVKHLYWGTPAENVEDSKVHGTYVSRYERTLAKYGPSGMKQIAAKAGKASGEAKRKPQEYWESFRPAFEAEDRTVRGWVQCLSSSLGISHTQVRRIATRLGL